MSDDLIVSRHGQVAVLRLNRPDARNALSPHLVHAIGAQLLAAEADSDVRVVVLTGTGDRAFCAGMDLRSFAAGEDMAAGDEGAMAAFNRLLEGGASLPVIGAANASAVAGGFELLLGCDLIVASTEASFGLPEVKRGLFPAGRGTYLGTRIPLNVAMEVTLTGDSFSAERAYQLGLVNVLVPADQVLTAALELAARVAANAPLGLAAGKELVRLAVSDPKAADGRLDHWRQVVFASEDAKEGATAFIEKRAPTWHGR